MKVRDVLADEVMDFGSLALPPIRQRLVVAFAPLPCRCDVTDRGIEPNVPVVIGTIRDGEPKIRIRTRDVPVSQWVSKKMALKIVRHFGLQVFAALRPLIQKGMHLF